MFRLNGVVVRGVVEVEVHGSVDGENPLYGGLDCKFDTVDVDGVLVVVELHNYCQPEYVVANRSQVRVGGDDKEVRPSCREWALMMLLE